MVFRCPTISVHEGQFHFMYVFSGLYYATKLQYLAIEINTTMNLYSLGYQEGMPVYQKWEELLNDTVCLKTNGMFLQINLPI